MILEVSSNLGFYDFKSRIRSWTNGVYWQSKHGWDYVLENQEGNHCIVIGSSSDFQHLNQYMFFIFAKSILKHVFQYTLTYLDYPQEGKDLDKKVTREKKSQSLSPNFFLNC